MNPSRAALTPTRLSPGPAAQSAQSGGLLRAWMQFWFTPVDPIGLHALRFLAGLLFLAWLLPLAGHLNEFFSLQGWFDARAYAESARYPDGTPRLAGWSILYLCGSDPRLLAAAYWVSVAAAALFTLGIWPRLTAILTWIAVVSFTGNPAIEDDAEVLLIIFSFYLMLGFVFLGQRGGGQSWLTRLLGGNPAWLFGRSASANADEPRPSLGANLALRLLQVHFAIMIVISGLHKLQFGDWWAGFALWFPLYPPLETSVAVAQEHARHADFYLALLSAAAYAMLAWQIGFPLFAGRPRLRIILLGGGAIGWLGTSFLYRLPLFGPALFLGCLSYLTPAEWRRALGLLTRIPGLNRLADLLPAPVDERDLDWNRDRKQPLVAGRHR